MKNALIALLFVLVFALAVQMASLQMQINKLDVQLFNLYAVTDCMISEIEDVVICANEIIGG